MLTQLKCEGDIAEQLAPKYITLSLSQSLQFWLISICKLAVLITFIYIYIYFFNLLFSLMLVVSL